VPTERSGAIFSSLKKEKIVKKHGGKANKILHGLRKIVNLFSIFFQKTTQS